MADKEVGIEIKTTVDTSGAEQAKEALEAVAAAGEKVGASANPFTDGSQLRAGKQDEEAAAVAKKTAAIDAQAEALEELTDAEAGVIRSTRQLDQTAANAQGFKSLFDQQRLQIAGREIERLGATIGDLVARFAETDRGKDVISGLSAKISEEATATGGLILKIGTSVAQAWAAGGPVAGTIAGVNEIVKELGNSFIAVAEAEQRGAQEFSRTQEETIRRARDRQEVASDRAIAEAFEEENRKLGDQNERLAENARLLNARRDKRAANFELEQERQRAAGVPEEQLRAEKIVFDARLEREKIRQSELEARYRAALAERETNVARGTRDDIARTKGTNSPEFAAAAKTVRDAEGAQSDAERQAGVAAREAEFQRRALESRTAARLQAEARQAMEDARRETERQADKARAEAEKAARERQQAFDKAESIADQAASAAGSGGPKRRDVVAAANFEQLGDALQDRQTIAGVDALQKSIERFAASRLSADADVARRFRKMAEELDGLRAKLRTSGDGR